MAQSMTVPIADGVRREVLDNGLRVIIKEIHAAPVVTCWAWYCVGSRNEHLGLTGASHWVEHMLFKGTAAFGKGEVMRQMSRLGGYLNGFTTEDHTVYFETLPREHLELGLRIESDRMVNAAFDPEEVDSERTVILSERAMAENDPGFLLQEEVQAAAFQVHPYHWPVLGWRCDLEQMTRDELYAYYRGHYAPNNCVLILTGDLDAAATLDLVQRHFGGIPAGATPAALRAVEPPQHSERRILLRQPAAASRVHAVYHLPAVGHPDLPAIVMCDSILSGAKPVGFSGGVYLGRSSRLHRALVEGGFASSVSCYPAPGVDPGLMHFRLMARDGVTAQAAEERLTQEIERMRAEPPTADEMAKAQRQTRAQYAYGADGVSNQAGTLGFYEATLGYRYLADLLEAMERVTPEQVQEVAQRYLGAENRTTGVLDAASGAAASAAPPAPGAQYSISLRPAFFSDGERALPQIRESALDNGLRVLVSDNQRSPAVVLRGSLQAGGARETDATNGLANITAAMLRRGAGDRTNDQIADAVEAVGGQINLWSSSERVAFAAKGLAADLPLLLEIIADCLRRPTFPNDQFELARGETLTALKDDLDDPRAMADQDLHEIAYPVGHPYRRHPHGTIGTVTGLSRDQMVNFHQTHYGPRDMIMVVVGAVEQPWALELISRYFGDWQAPGPGALRIPAFSEQPRGARKVRPMPHKSQADVCLGHLALARKDPDYMALNVADNILGRLGLMGRLGQIVRDEQGLAYYAYSSLEVASGRGLWVMRAGVAPHDVDRAIESMAAEMTRLGSAPPAADELADAQQSQIGSVDLRLETNDGVADTVHEMAYWNLGLDYLARYPDLIRAVTGESVMEVAARYSQAADSALAIAGPYEEAPA